MRWQRVPGRSLALPALHAHHYWHVHRLGAFDTSKAVPPISSAHPARHFTTSQPLVLLRRPLGRKRVHQTTAHVWYGLPGDQRHKEPRKRNQATQSSSNSTSLSSQPPTPPNPNLNRCISTPSPPAILIQSNKHPHPKPNLSLHSQHHTRRP